MTIIESIQQAEQKAAEIRKDAAVAARDIAADAAIERQKALDAKLAEAQKKAAAELKKQTERAAQKAAVVVEQGHTADATMAARASEKLGEAARFIVDRVKES